MISVSLVQLTEGGHFVLYPVILAKFFGPEGGLKAYSVGFSFVGFASITNSFIEPALFKVGFDVKYFCFLYGGLSILSLLLLITFFIEPNRPKK